MNKYITQHVEEPDDSITKILRGLLDEVHIKSNITILEEEDDDADAAEIPYDEMYPSSDTD
jgi:hypothetical protein